MTPYARVRLRKAVTLGGLGVILAALFNGVFHQMPVTAAVLGLGFGIGFVLGLVEFFWFDRSLRWLCGLYLSRWGHVPEFKAGLHAGEVVSAQIGGLKREVVYSGDVLNTTARIRSLCGELGEDLLVSRELQSQVQLPSGLETRPVESVSLRGKEREVGLVAIADPSAT